MPYASFPRLTVLATLTLALTACGSAPPSPEELPEPVASSSAASSEAPRPVTYQGQVQEAGISIYQEGTHRLVLPDGSFVLLQSSVLDLNAFLGQTVEVRGLERSTVEAGGLIVDVESASVAGASSTESASSAEFLSSAAVSAMPVPPPPAPVPAAESSAPAPTGELSGPAAAMAKARVDATTMTQQYCSGRAGFCVPIHRNGWWNAFGATGEAQWHVEVSTEEITELGQGPLAVDVLPASAGAAADGQVTVQGGRAVGYRSWEGKVIRISAPAELQTMAQYMLQNISLPPASASSAVVP